MDKILSTNVGIIIPTMNRPDFIIRLLSYYAGLHSPHTLYIADSSDEENANRIKAKIASLEGKLRVIYSYFPPGDTMKCMMALLSQTHEKYACYMGDDDYMIPGALSECAEFLEKNPDYELAIGHSISFHLDGGRAYGTLKDIHDYPRYSIEDNTASARLNTYLSTRYSPLVNCIIRTKNFLEAYEKSRLVDDIAVKTDYLPSCLLIISGKSKVIDRLCFVRQLHQSHYVLPDTFDWLTAKGWYRSYEPFRSLLVEKVAKTDGLSLNESEKVFKQAYLSHLIMLLSRTRREQPGPAIKRSFISRLRSKIAVTFPILKRIYRRTRAYLHNKPQLHYEVLQPDSKYYNDFLLISSSFKANKLD